MERLDEFRKKGWTFAIWLVPSGYIIQGSQDGKDHDWDFDIQNMEFSIAVLQAIQEIRRIERKAKR